MLCPFEHGYLADLGRGLKNNIQTSSNITRISENSGIRSIETGTPNNLDDVLQ
jgi:hypothetical protein